MPEREHREGQPQGSSSFIRPFQEKIHSFLVWAGLAQEAPKQAETPAQPSVEFPRVEAPKPVSRPVYEAPRYTPRQTPRYESRPRRNEGTSSTRRSSDRRSSDSGSSDSGWFGGIFDGGGYSGGYDSGGGGCDGGGGGGGD